MIEIGDEMTIEIDEMDYWWWNGLLMKCLRMPIGACVNGVLCRQPTKTWVSLEVEVATITSWFSWWKMEIETKIGRNWMKFIEVMWRYCLVLLGSSVQPMAWNMARGGHV